MTHEQEALFQAYKDFILGQGFPDGEIIQKDGMHLRLRTDYATGEVNFYDIDTSVVTELIINGNDGENKFYLHFELNDTEDLAHAKDLFGEMRTSFDELKDSRVLHVLLCCSSALTTTFFANRLNETAKMLSLDYVFSAVSYDMLFEKAQGAEVILIAPQIAFHYDEVKGIYKDKTVINIPPRIFASYHAGMMLTLIQDEITSSYPTNEEQAVAIMRGEIKTDARVLSIAVFRNWKQARIAYRVYEKGSPVYEETVIKSAFHAIEDLSDIMDTVIHRFTDYDMVGISLPGIIRDGHVDEPMHIRADIDLRQYLSERYHVPVFLCNDVNAAALGYYAAHDTCKNIALLYQPIGYYGGLGIVQDGHSRPGTHNIAGEMKYIINEHYPHKESDITGITPEIVLDITAFSVRAAITLLDPEEFCICCRMFPDTDRIHERLLETFPPTYLPKLTTIPEGDMLEYMLLGAMIYSLEEIAG